MKWHFSEWVKLNQIWDGNRKVFKKYPQVHKIWLISFYKTWLISFYKIWLISFYKVWLISCIRKLWIKKLCGVNPVVSESLKAQLKGFIQKLQLLYSSHCFITRQVNDSFKRFFDDSLMIVSTFVQLIEWKTDRLCATVKIS